MPIHFPDWWPGSVGPAIPTIAGFRLIVSAARNSDIVHVHGWRNPFATLASLVAVLYRRRLFLQPHGAADTYGGKAGLKRAFDRTVGRFLARRSAGFFVITTAEQEICAALSGQADKISLIGNPAPAPSSTSGLPGEAGQVLYLGRIHPKKGTDLLVEAWDLLFESGELPQSAELTIAGPDDGFAAHLKELVGASGGASSIDLVGSMQPADRDARLAKRPVVVVPSTSDIFPMVILEAAAAGCPLVISDAVQIASEVACETVICAPEPQSLADAIAKAFANRDSLSAKSLQLAERYSAGSIGADIVACYAASNRSASP